LLTDPVWYFYLFWFPKFMQKQFHYSLADLGATIWIPFLAADAGCLLGGWASGALVKRGIEPLRARLITLGVCAGAMLSSVAIPWAGSGTIALILASVGCCAVMAFMTNCVALPIDIFPSSRLGTVQGIIGTGGSLGGFLSQGLIAWLISAYSYKPVFYIIALAHPLAFSLLSFYLIKFVEHHRQHVSSEETSHVN